MIPSWGVRIHVQAVGIDFQRGRHGSRPRWLHQMRSDLGRLGAIAEILQVGPVLTPMAGALGVAADAVIYCRNMQGASSMRIFGAAAVIALLAGPAYAQTPNINLIPEMRSKSPEEKEADAVQGQGLQGIAEEDSGRQGVFRSVGQCAQRRYAEDGGSRQAAHQNRQHHELSAAMACGRGSAPTRPAGP